MPMNLYQSVIHASRYARWHEDEGRRETWEETVDRYFNYFDKHLRERHEYKVPKKVRAELQAAVENMEIMTSMRTLMTAGVALESCEVANYNCAYLPVDSVRAFSEHMFVLMAGSGSGFSVERRFTDKLPEIPYELHPTDTVVRVSDSRKGWCVAFNQFIQLLYAGSIPQYDTSKLRKEGERLKTFGGYSSGPKVLEELFEHTIKVFKNAHGRKLRPIEVFSIMTYIAQIVVVGGVRRSATICLFDKDDVEMRRSKSGAWWTENAHFAMANISAVFESKPDPLEFMDIWRDLIASGSGEPGFLNRAALWDQAEQFGRPNREENGDRIYFGVNPCSEIILRPYQFCNLTGIAIRPTDTLDDLIRKVRQATVLGTWQSTVSDFEYLRKVWKENVDEERLLGVCLAGMMDHPVLSKKSAESEEWLNILRNEAWVTNKELAKSIGINPTASPTAVKPAGNSGELYDVSSGIHPRYAPYYVRTIRQSGNDPMTKFLQDQGIPWEVSKQNPRDIIFSFPVKSPEHAVCADDLPALEQLEHWMMTKNSYTTHTVSCTIYVKKHEWLAVGAWVYENFDSVTGLSFLPLDDHIYPQAPYQKITKEAYEGFVEAMPKTLDWGKLKDYEQTDTTTVSQEFACVGGVCMIA
jgi:ribonucleoside-triphosphate reductase